MMKTVPQNLSNDAAMNTPIEMIGHILSEDMIDMNHIILNRMQSHVPMVAELAGYLIAAGGKRIRPLLTLACASLCGDISENSKKMAAAVEFIHTATLLHDDVVDGSTQRRGKQTANDVFGNQASVLVGDFLFARAFELMVETGNILALNSLAKASATITEGEVLQLSLIGETSITRAQYFKIIEAKTAALFAAACEVSPILNNQETSAFYSYGHCLGMAFQIIDDIMDYTSPKMGKNKGDDFMEGKITLPAIIAIESANTDDKNALISMIKNPNLEQLNDFMVLLEKYDSFTKARTIAKNYSDKASQSLMNFKGEIASHLIELPQSILTRSN
jgi:octaprenyl-diphosphate synthase